ncbi:hypothetical protein Dimus_010769 [Dionaea muscipula]
MINEGTVLECKGSRKTREEEKLKKAAQGGMRNNINQDELVLEVEKAWCIGKTLGLRAVEDDIAVVAKLAGSDQRNEEGRECLHWVRLMQMLTYAQILDRVVFGMFAASTGFGIGEVCHIKVRRATFIGSLCEKLCGEDSHIKVRSATIIVIIVEGDWVWRCYLLVFFEGTWDFWGFGYLQALKFYPMIVRRVVLEMYYNGRRDCDVTNFLPAPTVLSGLWLLIVLGFLGMTLYSWV